MQQFDMKIEQQQLFNEANKKLNSSFYRHTQNKQRNVRNLTTFNDNLCNVKPLPPVEPIVLYSVKTIQCDEYKKLHWYSSLKTLCHTYRYIVVLNSQIIQEYNSIDEAYKHANQLNSELYESLVATKD